MKVLVTGGAGFIGSHLGERLLSEGHAVAAVDNLNDFYDPAVKRRNLEEIRRHPNASRFTLIEADIRDEKAMALAFSVEKPDAVVHLAAMAGVRPSIENPLLYEDVNVKGTALLLETARLNHVRHFIFASSSSVYGNNPKVPFAETDNVDFPISPYAATKKAGELVCHTYAHLFQMNVSCLRFFTVYGPRQRPDLAIHKFTRLILEDKPIPFFGGGQTKRDYTYIDDIVGGVMKAVAWTCDKSAGSKYGIFNLGESRVISLIEMVQAIEKVLGKKAKLHKLPDQPGDVQCTYADITHSRKTLGYNPTTDFETGLRRFVDWFHATNRTKISS